MLAAVRLLGRPRVSVGGQTFEPPADRRSALLLYLACVGDWATREELLYLFWPDFQEHRARANLRQLLLEARAVPYSAGLEAERTRLRWPVETDFANWADSRWVDGARLVWPGELLQGFCLPDAPEFESWLALERSAWNTRFRSLLLARAKAEEGADDRALIDSLESLLGLEPLDEELLRTWMLTAAKLGRRAAALERFERFERDLMVEMGVAPDAVTVAVAEQLQRLDEAPNMRIEVQGASDSLLGSNAPAPSTSRTVLDKRSYPQFIGRTHDLERLREEVIDRGSRLTTVVGPGGIGKTRLALEAATRLAPNFSDGAVVVQLAEVSHLEGVAPSLAQKLGLKRGGGQDPSNLVLESLATRRMLIVLDNVDQIDGVAGLIGEWSSHAPNVAWLVTSRSRLAASGESIVELAGLPYPGPGEAVTAAFPAVELLLNRAHTYGSDLDLSRDAEAIGRVTRVTGGTPLALELAAGWLRVLPLAKIADEIRAGVDLSAAPDGGVEARHASLKAVFEPAWQSLQEGERRALIRLAAFHGGFDEGAARAAAGVGRPRLLVLRNRSMLSIDFDGRFGWHPLLETYVRERAERSGQAFDEARTAHARYFIDLLHQCEEVYRRGDSARAIATLKAEHPNLEAASERAIELGWWEEMQGWGGVLGLSYESAGQTARWLALIEKALKRAPRGSIGWAGLEAAHTSKDRFAGRYVAAYRRLAAVVEALAPLAESEPFAWGFCHLLYGQVAWALGRPEEARAALEVTVDGLRRAGKEELLCEAYANLLVFSEQPDDFEKWSSELDAWSLDHGRQGKDDAILGAHSSFLSKVYGDYRKAIEILTQELEHEREFGWHGSGIAILLTKLAAVHADAGHLQTASALLDEYFELHRGDWLLLREVHPDAVALRAHLSQMRGDPSWESYLPIRSRAASTPRGLLLRAETLCDAGDLRSARSYVQEASLRSRTTLVGLERSDWLLRSLLAQAKIDTATGETAAAIEVLVLAIELALEKHLLPGLLVALRVAAGLLPPDLAEEVVAFVVGHPATPGVARQYRPTDLTATVTAGSSVEVWHEACAAAAEVLGRLASTLSDHA